MSKNDIIKLARKEGGGSIMNNISYQLYKDIFFIDNDNDEHTTPMSFKENTYDSYAVCDKSLKELIGDRKTYVKDELTQLVLYIRYSIYRHLDNCELSKNTKCYDVSLEKDVNKTVYEVFVTAK